MTESNQWPSVMFHLIVSKELKNLYRSGILCRILWINWKFIGKLLWNRYAYQLKIYSPEKDLLCRFLVQHWFWMKLSTMYNPYNVKLRSDSPHTFKDIVLIFLWEGSNLEKKTLWKMFLDKAHRQQWKMGGLNHWIGSLRHCLPWKKSFSVFFLTFSFHKGKKKKDASLSRNW